MPKKRGIRVTLIVEDRALEQFSRAVLLKLGSHHREIRVARYPKGEGSAKQWVEKKYPEEVTIFRRKSSFQNLAIVVGTDADEYPVDKRIEKLAEALKENNLEPRSEEEKITLWIPKWNIETWLLHFAGDTRDEDKDYKHEVTEPDYRQAAQAFREEYRAFRSQEELDTLPSLMVAYKETQRMDN